MKLLRLSKICLSGIYSKVRIGKNLSGTFPIKICLKRCMKAIAFQRSVEYAIRKVQGNQMGLKPNEIH
jgi:hypothetical protein